MNNRNDNTITIPRVGKVSEKEMKFREILDYVYLTMKEKGYNHPEENLCGYFISGDPTYITSYKNARSLISKVDRYELMIYLIENFYKNIK